MTTADMPEVWADLLAALTLLAKHPTSKARPFQCSHDTLYVCADDTAFTADELAQLDEWGFFPDSECGGFTSFRFGSA